MTAKAPYPGLRPFDRDEANVFFGREEQTDQLLDKLSRHRFLAVVGPSGCGKSSLVRAGLIPDLLAGFMSVAGAGWWIAAMRPGRRPMRRLTEALLGEAALGPERGDGPEALAFLGATLRRGPLGLVEALDETPPPPNTNVLLLVDQFEEIFRFRSEQERNEADAFMALLARSAEQREHAIYVVITMRSDYIGDCGLFQGLPEHVSESQFLAPRLTWEQRKAAITGPARVFGGDVDAALVSRLLNETSSDPTHLPVLQHLLRRMWNRALHERQSVEALDADVLGPVLTLEHYTAVGGLKSALSNHANEAFDRLNEDQKRLAEVMFRRLCELGSGHLYMRRPTSVREISEVASVTPEQVIEVAEVFRDEDTSFIVPRHPEALNRGVSLDVSHESLIRQWDRLQKWVEDEAQSAKTYQRLVGDAELWQRNKAPLWRTPSLEIAQEWRRTEDPNKAWAASYGGDFDLAMRFLSASKQAQAKAKTDKEAEDREKLENARKLAEAERERAEQRIKLAEAEREQAEQRRRLEITEKQAKLTEAEKQRADTEQRRARDQAAAAKRYWRVAVAASALFIIAAGTSVWGWVSTKQAVRAEMQAISAEVQAISAEVSALAGNVKLAAVLSTQALEAGDNRTAIRILLEMFARNADRLDVLADEPAWPGLVKALHLAENALFEALYRPVGVVLEQQTRMYSANFSDDGRLVVTAADDGTVRIWDADTGKAIGEPISVPGQARYASFGPEARRVVVAFWNANSPAGSTTKIWDRQERRFVAAMSGHTAPTNSAAFSGDGAKILTTSFDNTARVWDADTGEPLMEFAGHTKGVLSAAFDPSGARIVTASFDSTARIWDAVTGEQMGQPLVHPAPVVDAQFDPEGKHIVTASMDNKARVWDAKSCEGGAETCKPIRTLQGHRKEVTSAMFSGDGERVVTASNDKTVRIWDWRKGTTLAGLQGPSGTFGWISRAVFDPAEDRVLTTFGGTEAYIWNLQKCDVLAPAVLSGHTNAVKYADFNVTGDRVVTASLDKTARVWDLPNAEQILELEHEDPVFSAAFDPTGRWIITAAGNTAYIWDQRTGHHVRTLDRHGGRLFSALFAPAGDRTVTASIDGTARIWNSGTGQELKVLGHHGAPVTHAAFSPGGKRVVTASTDGMARVWDAATGQVLHVLRGHDGTVTSAEFDASGDRIVTASVDETVRVWNAGSGELLLASRSEPPEPLKAASFSPDGRYIAAAAADGSARIMDAKSGATLATLLRQSAAVNWVAFDAAGGQMVTASADHTAFVWPFPSDLASKIEFACEILKPLTAEEQETLGPACSGVQVSAR